MAAFKLRFEVELDVPDKHIDKAPGMAKKHLRDITKGLSEIRKILDDVPDLKDQPVIDFIAQMELQVKSVERAVRVESKRRERGAGRVESTRVS